MKKIITISIFVMLLAFTTLLTTSTTVKAVSVPENTTELCSDGIDNDENLLTDLADPSCADFVEDTETSTITVPENTTELCSDGIDNDENLLTDLADPSCSAFAPAATTTTQVVNPPVSTTGSGNTSGPSFGGGSSGGGSSSFGNSITSGTPVSNVISTGTPVSATSTEPNCVDMFKTYMRKGKTNNVSEVKKLQAFLNQEIGSKLPITGFFGNLTHNAVKAFQLKYKDTILTPWGINTPTGYFYKTTQRQANLILCSTVDIPMPILN